MERQYIEKWFSNRGSRNDVRKRIITCFMEEEPGMGAGNDSSKYTYYVETLADGNRVYLTRPAFLNKGFDFVIRVENADYGHKGSYKNVPTHKPEKRFSDAVELKKFVQKSDTVIIPHNFSLDFFKKMLSESVILHFYPKNLPTKEIIAEWLDNKYREHIKSSAFQSTVNLLSLLNHISGVTKITFYKNVKYDLDKTPFIELLNFYDTLSDEMKELFIRNILLIILEVSKDDDLDLPFC